MSNQFIKDAMNPIRYIDSEGNEKEIDPNKVLTFDTSNIPFETQANMYFLIIRLSEKKRLEFKDMESQIEAEHSRLYLQCLNDDSLRNLNGNKKPPESMIENAISNEDSYKKLQQAHNILEYQSRLLNWLGKAVEMKSNLMISASAEHRQYMKNNTSNTIIDNY